MNTGHDKLITEIDDFLSLTGMGESYLGKAACGNSEVVKRLRAGRRVWPETAQKLRGFMRARRLIVTKVHPEAVR